MPKNCLNPKCQKEFTPKNKKGVYCSGNCRAAHAYDIKRQKRFEKTKEYAKKVVVREEENGSFELDGKRVNFYWQDTGRGMGIRNFSLGIGKSPEAKVNYEEGKEYPVANPGIATIAPPMPTRNEGENAFDYAQRKNEWKRLYSK